MTKQAIIVDKNFFQKRSAFQDLTNLADDHSVILPHVLLFFTTRRQHLAIKIGNFSAVLVAVRVPPWHEAAERSRGAGDL